MTRMVQVAVAGDVTEAEELESDPPGRGIDSQLEPAVDHHPAETEDAPQKVLVPETSLEAAIDAIESLANRTSSSATPSVSPRVSRLSATLSSRAALRAAGPSFAATVPSR